MYSKEKPKLINNVVNSNKLLELAKLYGLSGIPNNELESIGYIRNQDGSITREDAITRRKAKDESFNEKIENKPFGLIKMTLPEKELFFRRVDSLEIEKIKAFLKKAELNLNFDAFIKQTFGKENKIPFLLNEVMNYLYIAGYKDEEIKYLMEEFEIPLEGFLSEKIFELEGELPFDNLAWQADESEDSFLGDEKTKEFYEKLEKLKGKFSDVAALEEAKQKHHDKIKWIDSDDTEVLLENECSSIFNEKIKNNEIVTGEQICIAFFKEFLAAKGFQKVLEKINQCINYSAFKSGLQEIKPEEFPSFEEGKKMKDLVRRSSIEEKKKLSTAGKNLKEKIAFEKDIIKGMIEYCNTPELTASFFSRLIKKMQNVLYQKGKNQEMTFYIDGTPDPQMDKDPGQISGDCTEGKPLPFEDPNTLVYNVKFFDEEKKHIGNIYLLETETMKSMKGEMKKVWHLEAIQIPSHIDWEQGIQVLIDTISQEAQRKNVGIITVNIIETQISNYDYISEAVIKFHKNAGDKEIFIEMPKDYDFELHDNSKYSSFQGNGQVRILWERSPA